MGNHTVKYKDVSAYTTRDGSIIRELMHPSQHSVTRQSLAQATVPAGETTLLHFHPDTEEIYHVTAGSGLMTLGDETFEVGVGDTVCIAPGTKHCIQNTGSLDLKILCCCVPAYAHEDTVLVE